MTELQNLLTILSEECAETAQRVSKAIRFTPEEIQPGQDLSNAERIVYEFNDIYAVMLLLLDTGTINYVINDEMVALKQKKVKEYLEYSKSLGTVSEK